MLDFHLLKDADDDGDLILWKVAINALILFIFYFGGGLLIGFLVN